jgi:hypothetical protein
LPTQWFQWLTTLLVGRVFCIVPAEGVERWSPSAANTTPIVHQNGTELLAPRDKRLANLRPPWPKGTSGNPAGKQSRKSRHRKMVTELIADLGANVGTLDRILVEQAAWLLVQSEDHQRARNSGKPVPDEAITRSANGAARILLRLRERRRVSEAIVPLRERLGASA